MTIEEGEGLLLNKSMSQKLVKIAVIGVGHLGRYHALKLASLPEAELVGVVDIDAERAQKVAQECQTKAFTDFREILPRVEAVSVVVPTIHHYEVAREALRAGCHVFVEKPLAASPKEAKALVKMAKDLGLILQVGHIERFNPAIKRLLAEVEKPLLVEAQRFSQFSPRCLDVDVILDLMIHDIDLLLLLIKSSVVELQAAGAPVITNKTDIASVRLTFKNGVVANLTASRIAMKPIRRFRVFQKGSYLAADTLEGTFLKVDFKGEEHLPPEEFEPYVERFQKADPLLEELATFVQVIKNGGQPPVSGQEGFSALELAFKIKREIERQKAYFLAREGNCLQELTRHSVF